MKFPETAENRQWVLLGGNWKPCRPGERGEHAGSWQGFGVVPAGLLSSQQKNLAESKFTASPLAGNDAIWFTKIKDLGGWLAFWRAATELVRQVFALRRER